MTLRLDPVRRVGTLRIAALCRCDSGHLGAVAFGRKVPVAVLLSGPDGLRAFTPEGATLDIARLEARHPGLCARMEDG